MSDKKRTIIICLVFLLLTISSSFFLAKYYSNTSGYSSGAVAKWNNNIEIIGNSTILLDNNKINTKTLNFNLLSSSEVKSKFSVNLDNIPKKIKVTLSNDINTGSVIVSNNSVIVSLNNDEETFTLPSSETTTTIGNITMTSTAITNGFELNFTNDSNISLSIKIINNEDDYNVIFNNFGVVDKGDNQVVEHTLVFSTDVVNLPNASELHLYATFEQID